MRFIEIQKNTGNNFEKIYRSSSIASRLFFYPIIYGGFFENGELSSLDIGVVTFGHETKFDSNIEIDEGKLFRGQKVLAHSNTKS